jgi:ribosome recycling factor
VYQEIIEKIKPELAKTVDYFQNELKKIRTSRPSTALVEDIGVNIFGKKMPLKSLGQISFGEGREVVIRPWDASYLEAIEKAVLNSPLNMSPVVEKEQIRIRFSDLTKETRKNLVVLLGEKTEDARKAIRHWRTEAWKEIQDEFAKSEITEDDKYRGKDKLQELIDEYNEKIAQLSEEKKKEIME